MPIRDRKSRQQEALRTAIVDAAYALVEEGGEEAVSIRAIADRIEYSLRTIYLYFTDKEAILDAVRERGFEELAALLADTEISDYAGSPEQIPRERLKRLGSAYLRFAVERSRLFRVMYFRIPQMFCDPISLDTPVDSGGGTSFSILLRAVAAYLGSGTRITAEVRALSVALWGMVHGLAAIELFNQNKDFVGLEVPKEYERAFDILIPVPRSV